jgi:hypothetical protein
MKNKIEKIEKNEMDVEKITFINGEEINLKDKNYIVIFKNRDIDKDIEEYIISFNIANKEDKEDSIALSNHSFMISNCIKYMNQFNIEFNEALAKHKAFLEHAKNRNKERRNNESYN